MRTRSLYRLFALTAACILSVSAVLTTFASAAAPLAHVQPAANLVSGKGEFQTPITVEVVLTDTPAVGEKAGVTIRVTSEAAAKGTRVNLVVDDGVAVEGAAAWVVDLDAGTPVELTTDIAIVAAGNHTIAAYAAYDAGPNTAWGDTGTAFLHSDAAGGRLGFVFQGDPASGAAEVVSGGAVTVAPSEAYPDGTLAALKVDAPLAAPATSLGPAGSAPSDASVSGAGIAGTLTVKGQIGYYDRAGNAATQPLLAELLTEAGGHLAWAYTGWDGRYTFPAVSNPGRFRVRAWAYYRHTSMTHAALRVIPLGAGGDLFDVSNTYRITTAALGPVADGTITIGVLRPGSSSTYNRPFWILGDLLKAFYFPWYAVPPGGTPGTRQPDGATVEWQTDSTEGARYDLNHILLGAEDAYSAHTVTHEYGHASMHSVYGLYWPPTDCGDWHGIGTASGIVCAWTEGWADYWSLIVLNDPIYTWGCAPPCTPNSRDLENRTGGGGTWDRGDQVEGNVAGTLWDWGDSANEGNDVTDATLAPFWKIWDVFYTQNDDTFQEFWYAWQAAGNNTTNTLSSVFQNTIDYGWSSCPDRLREPDNAPSNLLPLVSVGATQTGRALCTVGDVDWYRFKVVTGYGYDIRTLNLSATNDTTLTLYASDGTTQLAFDDEGGGGQSSFIRYVSNTTGQLFVAVRRVHGYGDFGYTYDLRITNNLPPTVESPLHALVSAQTLSNPSAGIYNLLIQETWFRSDANGIASQQLQINPNGSGFVDIAPQPAASASSYNLTLTVGSTYQVRLRAVDTLGAYSSYQTGGAYTMTGIQDTSSAIIYSGSWTNWLNSAHFGGSLRYTNGAAGTKATVSFVGTSVGLVATQAADGGQADLYLDGVYKGRIDFYASSTRTRRMIVVLNGLARTASGGAAHQLEVRWVTSHNAASIGYRLYLDGAIALN